MAQEDKKIDFSKLSEKQKAFCNEYIIYSSGKIWSIPRLNRKKAKIGDRYLKPVLNNVNGYKYIGLTINNKHVNKSIHRLVAENFIPNPENKPEVNHKDGNKLNNDFSNLEWVTSKENQAHAIENGLVRNKTKVKTKAVRENNKKKRKLSEKDQEKIGSLIGVVSQAEISRIIGVSPQTIMRFIKGTTYNY